MFKPSGFSRRQLRKSAKARRAAMPVLGAVVLSLFLGASLQTSASSAGGETRSPYPMWGMVPADSFAVLEEGRVRNAWWGAYTYRRPTAGGGLEPCLLVTRVYSGAPFEPGTAMLDPGVSKCGRPAPPGPVVNTSAGISLQWNVGGRDFTMKAQAMTFASNVHSVRLELDDGTTQTRRTERLSHAQARKAHVKRFSYLAYATSPSECVENVTAFDRKGAELASLSLGSC